jgi:hypothetical protein
MRIFTARLLLFASLIFCLSISEQVFAGDLSLHPTVMKEMNVLLRTSDELHVGLFRSDEEFIEIAIRDLGVQIDRLWAASSVAKSHERYHLLKILDSAREHLDLAQSSYGEERKEHFKFVYRQLVNIVRIYRVSASYSIYFCDKVKASWVQKGVLPKNPFAPSSRCGVRVPNNTH